MLPHLWTVQCYLLLCQGGSPQLPPCRPPRDDEEDNCGQEQDECGQHPHDDGHLGPGGGSPRHLLPDGSPLLLAVVAPGRGGVEGDLGEEEPAGREEELDPDEAADPAVEGDRDVPRLLEDLVRQRAAGGREGQGGLGGEICQVCQGGQGVM